LLVVPQVSPPSGSWRVIGVAIIVSALTAWAALASYGVSRRLAEQNPDPYGAARARSRLAPAFALLPATGPVFYITDMPPGGSAGAAAFLAAQNVLAPRLLFTGASATPPRWAIGNFARPADFTVLGAKHGYTFVRDCGNGVVVYQRK
jgi:hypothetical protein